MRGIDVSRTDRTMRALIGILAIAALAAAAPASAQSSDKAPPDGQAGYFPDQGRGQPGGGDAAVPAFEMPPNPVRFGFNVTLGTHVPVSGDLAVVDGRQEFRGTGDIGGGVFVALHGLVQLDLNVRGGAGGLSPSLYEERYRYTELAPKHLWLGGHLRVMPFSLGPIQPFASVAIGADRVFAAARAGTGVYVCEDNGWTIRCEEEDVRVFAAGYWGGSFGAGAGLRIGTRRSPIAFTAESLWMRNHYGVRTSTDVPNDRLGPTAPSTNNLAVLLNLHLHFN